MRSNSPTPGRMQRMERTARWFTRRIAGPGTGRPAPLAALRMALAMALPLGLGLWDQRLDLGTVGAIAALFTAIIEPGGGYRRHLAAYAAVTVLNVLVVVLAVAVSTTAILAALVMLVLGLLAGMATSWGSVPTLAAPAPLGLFILTQGLHPTPRMGEAVIAVLIGSGWVALISVAPWPIAPYAPAELAVGDAWLSVAALARDVGNPRLEAAATTAIEQARDVVATIRSRRAGWSERSHRLWANLVAAQRCTMALEAIGDDRRREPASDATRGAMDDMLAETARTAAALAANAVLPEAHPDLQPLEDAARAVRHAVPATDGLTGPPLHAALVAAARARAAARLLLRLREGTEALDLPTAPDVHVPHEPPPDWRARVRASLSPRSTGLRHGLRLGIACGVSMGVFTAIGPEGLLGVHHGAWVTITLMVVLRPTLGDSVQSAIQRGIGTALGGVIAVAMLAVLAGSTATAIGVIVVAALAALLHPVNSLWYVVLFTPIPLIFAASTGLEGTDIAVERLIATGLAVGVGLLLATLLWPSRSGRELPGAMAEALRSDAVTLDAILDMVTGRAKVGSAFGAQRDATLAADEATRVAQAELMESLTAFSHPRPVVALETSVLRLPRDMAVLGARAWNEAVDVPGIDDVRGGATSTLRSIASAMEDHRAPDVPADLVASLDPAWEELRRREAAGDPDLHLAAVVDGLDSILHDIARIGDDATAWAASGRDGRGNLLRRLMPHPAAAPVVG